jgi:dUTP pyrophosphatase
MKYSKIRNVKSPNRGTSQSAGVDFYVPEDWNDGKPLILKAGERALIPSGIKVNVPTGHALIAFNKSGVASKKGLIVGACVVDEDYQGEIHINVINTCQRDLNRWDDTVWTQDLGEATITPGEKLVQFILLPVLYASPEETEIEELYSEKTERGDGGFGSTGV